MTGMLGLWMVRLMRSVCYMTWHSKKIGLATPKRVLNDSTNYIRNLKNRNMLTEDFVSFEIAKLLKEKGFDEPCRVFYKDPQAGLYEFKNAPKAYKDKLFEPCFLAPSLYMAMKWLREKGISIEISSGIDLQKDKTYWAARLVNLEAICEVRLIGKYDTYELAVEKACIYSLKNLI